jgi:O-antigen ligase
MESLPFSVLVGVLLFIALPVGGDQAWSIHLAATLLCGALALELGWRARRPESTTIRRTWSAWPWAAGLLVWLVQALLWCWLPDTPGRHDLQQGLARTVLYVSAGWLVLLTSTTHHRVMILAATLLGAGVLQVVLGVLLMSAPERLSMLGMQLSQSGRALGTFVNADHFANYLLLCFGVGAGLMLSQRSRRAASTAWQAQLASALEFLISPRMLIRLALVALVIGLVLSRSRMGNGAFVLSLLMLGLGAWRARPASRKTLAVLMTSFLLIDLLVLGQWVGLDKVVERMEQTAISSDRTHMLDDPQHGTREETLQERLRLGRDAWQMALERPWTGHGPGRFGTVFPAYKAPDNLPVWVDHAHNDYAQVAAENGLPMLLVGLAMCAATFWRLWRLLSPDQPWHSQGMAAGLLMALTAMALHCMVDFNLQVAANALTFSVLLGLAWALPETSKP